MRINYSFFSTHILLGHSGLRTGATNRGSEVVLAPRGGKRRSSGSQMEIEREEDNNNNNNNRCVSVYTLNLASL